MMHPQIVEPPLAPDRHPNVFDHSDPLAIPPLDPLFLSAQDPTFSETLNYDLGLLVDGNSDFDFTFDGLDDFDFPIDCEPYNIPSEDQVHPDQGAPEGGISEVPGDRSLEEAARYLDCSIFDRKLNFPSPTLSRGSGNCGSGVSEDTYALSPNSSNLGFDQKVESEENGKNSVLKRKNENACMNNGSRGCKYRKSDDNAADTCQDEKRKLKLMRNRECAHLSRQRRKQYVEGLEGKIKSMHSAIVELNSKISYIMAENVALKHQLNFGALYPLPMPPMQPMPYPWVPYAPDNAHGTKVPLVPIPRLKAQEPFSCSKVKKSERKKIEGKSKTKRVASIKTKRVASISFIGLVFFIFLFGGLVPFMNVRYGGISETIHGGSNYASDWFYDQHRGKILMVNGHSNGYGSDSSKGMGILCNDFDASDELSCQRGSSVGNASEPLFASLFVPRNDKLVKIDGNLIIHSILASEKAVASKKAASETNKAREASTSIPNKLSSALAIPDVGRNGAKLPQLYRDPNEHPKALSSGSVDGKSMRQWFRESVAGPMLNPGMCTEVFQFDISPDAASGPLIPASSISNTSAEHHHDATRLKKSPIRRILQRLSVPTGSEFNITGDYRANDSEKERFQGSKSFSSTVVSVLIDPREAGDADMDGMTEPKSLSRVFVVVLLDSVKYVTYSCIIPRSGLHLVTT